MGRLFITGDCHHNFDKIYDFCDNVETTTDDIMIIAGDAGINYYLDSSDKKLKKKLSKLPITLMIVHGNHEERAWKCEGYIHDYYKIGSNNIIAWAEPEFPNILFVDDFSMHMINGKRFLFVGGAYSVDKHYRRLMGWNWFPSEQISEEDMDINIKILKADRRAFDYTVTDSKYQFDYIISHTCPLKYEPVEMFISGIDQSKVDKRTEEFLDKVEEIASYNSWICGHYHTQKTVDKIRFMYHDIVLLG